MVALDLHPSIARALLSAAAIAAALIVTVSHAAFGSTFKVGSIVIETPWSRATPGGAKVGVGYLTIKNDGATPDRLVSATAAIAGRTEIHLMSMDDGVMKMRPVADGVPVPANGSLVLGPNSYHLMFMDLARQLKQGRAIPCGAGLRACGHSRCDVRCRSDWRGGATGWARSRLRTSLTLRLTAKRLGRPARPPAPPC